MAGSGKTRRCYCANAKEKGASICTGMRGLKEEDAALSILSGLSDEGVSGRASEELHQIIDTVVVTWDAGTKHHALEVGGKLLDMLNIRKPALGAGLGICESSLKLVAGVGFEPTTFRL